MTKCFILKKYKVFYLEEVLYSGRGDALFCMIRQHFWVKDFLLENMVWMGLRDKGE